MTRGCSEKIHTCRERRQAAIQNGAYGIRLLGGRFYTGPPPEKRERFQF